VRIAIAIAVLLPFLAGCGSKTGDIPGGENLARDYGGGPEYKQALLALLRRSNRIVVSEHSSEFDLFDSETGESKIPKTIIYGTHELTGAEAEYFNATIQALDTKTQDAFSACVPAVHHTIRFYSGQQLIDTMEICFECSQVLWSGTRATPPWSLYSGLAEVIERVGFTPDRDWPKVARQHLK
jgi:hypothetical protein